MVYNMDFLIAAMVILLLILWNFLGQKRADDLNNQIFLFFAVLGILDVAAELLSNYYISLGGGDSSLAAIVATTVFYLFQALLPFTLTLHDNKMISAKKMLLPGLATFLLIGLVLINPFTEKLYYFDLAEGYVEGPWYKLMYYSAFCHMAAAFILIISWGRRLGYRKTMVLLEILVISGSGVVIQFLDHSLLMTGFGLSLGILSLFITINNPNVNTDSLTGVYNHLYLTRKCEELIATGKSFHIITVYLYQLKYINKIIGIQGGDRALQLTADMISDLCGKKAYRITGKRFLVVAGSMKEYEYFLTKLEQMFGAETSMNVDRRKISMPVILSGITEAQELGDCGLILEYAEYLESLAAQSGLTEVIQNDSKNLDGFLYQKKVEQYLHTAISEDRFELYYQPVYSTVEKRFVTLEALSRLHHPELGWIAPDVFIQIAEKNHMIEQITDLQLRRICRFLKENCAALSRLWNVKMNLSSLDLMRNDCSSHFIRIMDEFGIPHDWIQFEITETVATEYNGSLKKVADDFTAAGVRLCLDDFGSGYANLNTVMQLPFSSIKLDRSLLFDICSDEKRAQFYQSVVEIFQRMNYRIVAEGVETEAEMRLLSSWNVDMIQGYYFSKPLPQKGLLELLKQSYA